tara:strand:- start:314 stop:460 length:147 start_codon:yes stop_codon:yes gene_type:complete
MNIDVVGQSKEVDLSSLYKLLEGSKSFCLIFCFLAPADVTVNPKMLDQ